jgi:hypothetical protein
MPQNVKWIPLKNGYIHLILRFLRGLHPYVAFKYIIDTFNILILLIFYYSQLKTLKMNFLKHPHPKILPFRKKIKYYPPLII